MKGKKKTPLTNEQVLMNFPDNFSLAQSAIVLARQYVEAGKEFHLRTILDDAARKEIALAEERVESRES